MDHVNFVRETGAPDHLYLLHAALIHYVKMHWAPQRQEPSTHELVKALYYMGSGRHLIKWLYVSICTRAAVELTALWDTWVEDRAGYIGQRMD